MDALAVCARTSGFPQTDQGLDQVMQVTLRRLEKMTCKDSSQSCSLAVWLQSLDAVTPPSRKGPVEVLDLVGLLDPVDLLGLLGLVGWRELEEARELVASGEAAGWLVLVVKAAAAESVALVAGVPVETVVLVAAGVLAVKAVKAEWLAWAALKQRARDSRASSSPQRGRIDWCRSSTPTTSTTSFSFLWRQTPVTCCSYPKNQSQPWSLCRTARPSR